MALKCLALASLLLAGFGCGGNSNTYTCCINTKFYDCPDQTSEQKACSIPSDTSGCTRDTSKEPCN
jgi:hypothetical protein